MIELLEIESCNELFTPDGINIIKECLGYFRILAPAVLILLISIDLFTILSGRMEGKNKEEVIAKNTARTVRRIIAVILLFFVPTIVKLLLGVSGIKGALVEDPLCYNSTGTEAKGDLYAESGYSNEIKVEHVLQFQLQVQAQAAEEQSAHMQTSNGGVKYGEGNSNKRSYKTVTVNGRTYDMYNQHLLGDIAFTGGNGNMAAHGCSACAFATAVSGFRSDLTAYDAAKMVNARSFDGIKHALNLAGVSYSGPYFYNSNDFNEKRIEEMVQRIRDHLAQGKPVIALVTGGNNGGLKYASSNHFITFLGEDSDGKVIISNCRTELGDLYEIVKYYMGGGRKGVLLVG